MLTMLCLAGARSTGILAPWPCLVLPALSSGAGPVILCKLGGQPVQQLSRSSGLLSPVPWQRNTAAPAAESSLARAAAQLAS
jgi:hypothetical protein